MFNDTIVVRRVAGLPDEVYPGWRREAHWSRVRGEILAHALYPSQTHDQLHVKQHIIIFKYHLKPDPNNYLVKKARNLHLNEVLLDQL